MNFKLITKALHALSLLSAEDFDLTIKLHTSTEGEREGLIAALSPLAKPTKKAGKKVVGQRCAYVSNSGIVCNKAPATTAHINDKHVDYHEFQPLKAAGKSKRAASLSNQIQTRALDGGVFKMRCTATVNRNGFEILCGEYADHNVHHLESADGYHEFTIAKDGNYEAQAVGAGGD